MATNASEVFFKSLVLQVAKVWLQCFCNCRLLFALQEMSFSKQLSGQSGFLCWLAFGERGLNTYEHCTCSFQLFWELLVNNADGGQDKCTVDSEMPLVCVCQVCWLEHRHSFWAVFAVMSSLFKFEVSRGIASANRLISRRRLLTSSNTWSERRLEAWAIFSLQLFKFGFSKVPANPCVSLLSSNSNRLSVALEPLLHKGCGTLPTFGGFRKQASGEGAWAVHLYSQKQRAHSELLRHKCPVCQRCLFSLPASRRPLKCYSIGL